MLLFEFVPSLVLIVCMVVGLWLVAIDRQSRQRPIDEQTTLMRLPRRRS